MQLHSDYSLIMMPHSGTVLLSKTAIEQLLLLSVKWSRRKDRFIKLHRYTSISNKLSHYKSSHATNHEKPIIFPQR